MGILEVMKVKAIGRLAIVSVPYLDAVSGTQQLFQRLATAIQIVGFAGSITILAGIFAVMAWASDRLRDRLKGHLVWVIIAIIGLFAAAALATFFKSYSQGSF